MPWLDLEEDLAEEFGGLSVFDTSDAGSWSVVAHTSKAAKRAALGLCTRCGSRPARAGMRSCVRCAVVTPPRVRSADTTYLRVSSTGNSVPSKAARRASGKCVDCGHVATARRCERCAEKTRAHARASWLRAKARAA